MGSPGLAANESRPEEGGSESQKLDLWQLRDIYIQAAAAGVTDDEYSRLTLSKVLARIESAQLNRFWIARPIITAMLPHLSEESLKEIASGTGGKGDGWAARALEQMLSEYMPPFMKAHMTTQPDKIVPNLPPEAAAGLVEFFRRGDLDGPAWASISRWWPRISATARRLGG